MGNGVTLIGKSVILGCDALGEVTCNALPLPSLSGGSVFVSSMATLYVPTGTYNVCVDSG